MNADVSAKLIEDDNQDEENWSPIIKLDHSDVIRNPVQPRKYFDPLKMKELEDSLAGPEGQRDPVKVMPADANGKYMLIGGERRWTALGNIGKTKIQARVYKGKKNAAQLHIAALTDNLHNDPMIDHDMALALLQVRTDNTGFSDADVAREMSMEYAQVRRLLMIARMHQDVAVLIRPDAPEGYKISTDGAYQIASKVDYDDQPYFIERAAKAAQRLRDRKPKTRPGIPRAILINQFEQYEEQRDAKNSSPQTAVSSKPQIDPSIRMLINMAEAGKVFGDTIDPVLEHCTKKQIQDFFDRTSATERSAIRKAFKTIGELAEVFGYK